MHLDSVSRDEAKDTAVVQAEKGSGANTLPSHAGFGPTTNSITSRDVMPRVNTNVSWIS